MKRWAADSENKLTEAEKIRGMSWVSECVGM